MKDITPMTVCSHCEGILNEHGFVYPLPLRWHTDDVQLALDNSPYERDWTQPMQLQILEQFFGDHEEEIIQFINERLQNYIEERIEQVERDNESYYDNQ